MLHGWQGPWGSAGVPYPELAAAIQPEPPEDRCSCLAKFIVYLPLQFNNGAQICVVEQDTRQLLIGSS